MMKKEDGLIDWSSEARQIHNLVRGLDPWPGAYTLLDGQTLKVAKTCCVAGQGTPGQVLEASGDTVVVACGQGALQLGALQLPGKKMLNAADFLRGRGLEKGTQLGS